MINSTDLVQVKASLFAGHYNLLLGSGASMDSSGGSKGTKKPLQSATALTKSLCELKRVSLSTTLSRVSLLLSPNEVTEYLTEPYSKCKPGITVKRITGFVWKSIYTFNIDDSLEAAYDSTPRRRQKAESFNYDDNYRTAINKGHTSIIHLHGFVRQPDKGYVFSVSEYARVTKGMNPWMHVLSELLASEPFIVAGTSLNESDLEYYLSARTQTSLRTNRGPSILVEPFPDAITENLCERHGFILVKALFSDFLQWLITELGHPPSIEQLTIPSAIGLFNQNFSPENQIEFYSSYELVREVSANPDGQPSAFFFGKSPLWSDIESGLDLPTDCERRLSGKIKNHLESQNNTFSNFLLLAESGSGKTTTIRRIAYDLAREGKIVFNLTGKLALDPENTRAAIIAVAKPMAIIVDNIADHASSIKEALSGLNLAAPLAVICADRDYRREHINRIMGDLNHEIFTIEDWKSDSFENLVELFRKAGLVGTPEALRIPRKFAQMLVNDPVAIAVCRILNNFKPLDTIVGSLWSDSHQPARNSYALAALSEFCYAGGIQYPILERAQQNSSLAEQISLAVPLPLAYSEDGEHVIPLHPAVGERLLRFLTNKNRDLLLDLFVKLALALAPYVNRQTIIDRTPEARLAGRLFNAEHVVKYLLKEKANEFYTQTKEAWQWNSRYWEQRAILTQDSNIENAIQYARHAIVIEEHPFSKTTLASILVRKMEIFQGKSDVLFDEVYTLLKSALKDEAQRGWRPTPHPYSVLFHCATAQMDSGGKIDLSQRKWLLEQNTQCQRQFSRDVQLLRAGEAMKKKLRL